MRISAWSSDWCSSDLTVANEANAHAIAHVLAPQVAKLAEGYSHVFGPSTTFGKDLMPCVAALLGTAQVSDIMAVEGSHTFKRPIYAGNAIVIVEAPAEHRSAEHTSELQSLMRTSYAVFCLKKKTHTDINPT